MVGHLLTDAIGSVDECSQQCWRRMRRRVVGVLRDAGGAAALLALLTDCRATRLSLGRGCQRRRPASWSLVVGPTLRFFSLPVEHAPNRKVSSGGNGARLAYMKRIALVGLSGRRSSPVPMSQRSLLSAFFGQTPCLQSRLPRPAAAP
uniref:Uncharacterized protein n=1 Tax=Plectus sambesii TaxID=2011161 RepID=A0A914XS34_9BILA